MNKRILSVVLVAVLAVALVVGGIVVSAADGVTTAAQLEDLSKTDGATIRLGKNVGTNAPAGYEALNVSGITITGKNVTIDLNGYTIWGTPITVNAGASLTIVDSDQNQIGRIVTGTTGVITLNGTDKDHVATLNITSGTIADLSTTDATSGAAIVANNFSVVNVNGGKIDVINGRYAVKVASKTATVNVNAGTVDGIDAQLGGVANVKGGTVTGNSQYDNGAELNVTDGTLKGEIWMGNADATLDGGVVEAKVNMGDRSDIYVDGATIKGVIGKNNGQEGDLDVHSGYFTKDAKIDIDTPDITGGVFEFNPMIAKNSAGTEVNLLDNRRASCVEYDNWGLDKDGKHEEKPTLWLVGQKVIAKYVAEAECVIKDKIVYPDTFTILLNAEDLTLTVDHPYIYVGYAKDVKGVCVVNGYQVGSALQVGGDKQPMHKWATKMTAAQEITEASCKNNTILQNCFEDTLDQVYNYTATVQGKYYAKANADGTIAAELFDMTKNAKEELPDENHVKSVTIYGGLIRAAGHQMLAVAFKAPTATEAGVYPHYLCKLCGKMFLDYEGDVPYVGDPTIPALGTGTTTTPTDPTPTDPEKKPDEGGSDVTTDPGKTGDVDNFAWVVCLAVSAIGAVAVAGSMVASKKYDR